jgi:hypothetical protein
MVEQGFLDLYSYILKCCRQAHATLQKKPLDEEVEAEENVI